MTADRDLAADLALGLELAEIADAITLPYYQQRSFSLDWKSNHTEVTEADREAESAISTAVIARRPDDGLFGEEHGVVGNADSPWRWVIDPIDGTSNFVRGIPVWASLIALTHQDRGPVVGVVSAPALGRRWWAAKGLGAFADGRACRVSEISQLDEAQVCVTFSSGWDDAGLTAGARVTGTRRIPGPRFRRLLATHVGGGGRDRSGDRCHRPGAV